LPALQKQTILFSCILLNKEVKIATNQKISGHIYEYNVTVVI